MGTWSTGILKIAILDDNADVADSLARMFSVSGHECFTFQSALGFLTWWQHERQKPDLCVIDVGMPGISGVEAIATLRRRDAQTPIVVLTGYGDARTASAAALAGADELLVKPASLDSLFEAFARAIAKRRGSIPQDPASPGARDGDESASSLMPPRMLAAMGELVGSYCHDINNALAASLANLEVVRLSQCDREPLDDAIQAQARAIEHVRSLQQFVRPLYRDAPQPLQGIEKARLGSMIRQIHDTAGARGRLRVDVSDLPDMRLPAVLLNALLYPSISNAVEASTVPEALRLIIKLGVDDLHQTLQLSVADNGPGWPKQPDAILAGLFTNSRYTTKGAGRGNGLRNLNRLVSRLGGGMHIQARRRRGATVIVRVPLAGVVYEQ